MALLLHRQRKIVRLLHCSVLHNLLYTIVVYYIIQHMEFYLPPVPGPVVITSSSSSFFKISITWDPPELRNGIIIAYVVSYRPASAPQIITTMNTTDLDTSFTIEGGLELETAYIFTVTAFTGAGHGEIATASISTLARPRKMRALCVTSTHTGIQYSYYSSSACMCTPILSQLQYKEWRWQHSLTQQSLYHGMPWPSQTSPSTTTLCSTVEWSLSVTGDMMKQ